MRARAGAIRRLTTPFAGVIVFATCLPWTWAARSEDIAANAAAEALLARYVAAWVDFYPSRAFAYGRRESAGEFESVAAPRVEAWLATNRSVNTEARALLNVADTPTGKLATDLRIVHAKTADELANWKEDEPLRRQPQWFAEQVSQALTHLLVRDQLAPLDRSDALERRLIGVALLCEQATKTLEHGKTLRTDRALATLAAARRYYQTGLQDLISHWPEPRSGQSLAKSADSAATAIFSLEAHIREVVLPASSPSPSIGGQSFDAKLSRRTWGAYRAASLEQDALLELKTVRGLMVSEAERWRDILPEAQRAALVSLDGLVLLDAATAAMEANRQSNSADFLASFRDLTGAAQRFVRAHDLATIPTPTTLLIALSPSYFSGAAVGGVYPSGPFDPEADTLFYIPSIPDTADEMAKAGFYRSFNTHFNTMILSHEMFPGHYLQYKVAVKHASHVRTLFSNGSYTEGWGTFVEKLMLDAGWGDSEPLTMLAHLRKRLENATRAYVSVKVHMDGWGESEVISFARDEGLLAPQFATNLWQRVVNSPLQITDYFTGGREFQRLYAQYVDAAQDPGGDSRVSLKSWVDAVLRAGPIPLTLLKYELVDAGVQPAEGR